MSALPRPVVQFYSIFMCDKHPAWIPLRAMIGHALTSQSPSAAFTTAFRRLPKLQRARLQTWLNSATTERRAIDAGASGALHAMRTAVSNIIAGVGIRDAFDLRRPGAQRQLSFSHHEKVAALVEVHARAGVRLSHINLGRYDIRSINRIRAAIFKSHADRELKALAWSFCVTG